MKWNEEEKQFLIDNVKNISLKELQTKFNKEFNCNVSENAVACQKNKLGLKSGITGGQYKKGNVPDNKGKKWADYMSENGRKKSLKTTFKKGNIPQNYRPVGSERVGKDNYLEIKYADPNKWEGKHRYLYKKYHGAIPKNHIVIFADGDIRNFTKENLIAITKNENARLNQNKLRFNDIELTKTSINLVKYIIKTNEIKNTKKAGG